MGQILKPICDADSVEFAFTIAGADKIYHDATDAVSRESLRQQTPHTSRFIHFFGERRNEDYVVARSIGIARHVQHEAPS
jgi:hypothetical protein